MHDMMGQYGMDDDANHHQSSEHHGNYSNDVWGGIPANSYSSPQQTSPIYEYHNYQLSNHGLPQSLPEEPTFTRMPPPPAQQQTLLPLLPAPMPNNPTWMSNMPPMSSFPPTMPSMLTNPGPGHQARPVPFALNSGRMKASKPASQPHRRPLTTEKKREMCEYHVNNPSAKQADIGGKFLYSSCQTEDANICTGRFGVERRYALEAL